MKARVAIIDDLSSARELLARSLAPTYEPQTFDGVQAALDALEGDPPDCIVTDLKMPGIDGLTGVKLFAERLPGVPVVMVTAFASVETAVEAIKAGAFDYLRKPFEPEELELVVARAVEHGALRQENARLRREVEGGRSVKGVVGRSPAIREMATILERVAPTDVPVLIEGESGTGKDLVALALHGMSRRAAGPYVAINMAAIPEGLAESELFGHEKGAFSGATSARMGYFASAKGGTLFLDEIGTLAPGLQPKLLRVLQSGEYVPVGGSKILHTDVRIVCATNENLKRAVEEGRFREDLMYRIRVVAVRLPPLRERREDLPLLAEHFVKKHAPKLGRPALPFGPDALRALLAYGWPGNVRELENAVERALLLARGETIGVEDLPEELRHLDPDEGAGSYRKAKEAWEKKYLEGVLREAGGSAGKAAELAGLHRSTLYEKLARYGLVGS